MLENLDDAFEETRRVNCELGKVLERNRIIEIIDYCRKQTNSTEGNAMLLVVRESILDSQFHGKVTK